MTLSPRYIPGMCNIGPDEIRSKKALGWVGIVITVLFFAITQFVQVSYFERLFIFLPVLLALLGFVQGFMRFCVTLGLNGFSNMTLAAGKREKVVQQEYCVQDRFTARLILLSSIAASALLSLLVSFA